MSEQIAKWLETAGLSVSAPFTSRGHAGSSRRHGWQLITGTDTDMPVEKFQALYAEKARLEKEIERLRAQLAVQQSAGPVAYRRKDGRGVWQFAYEETRNFYKEGWEPLYTERDAANQCQVMTVISCQVAGDEVSSVYMVDAGTAKLKPGQLLYTHAQPVAAIDERAEFERLFVGDNQRYK